MLGYEYERKITALNEADAACKLVALYEQEIVNFEISSNRSHAMVCVYYHNVPKMFKVYGNTRPAYIAFAAKEDEQ